MEVALYTYFSNCLFIICRFLSLLSLYGSSLFGTMYCNTVCFKGVLLVRSLLRGSLYTGGEGVTYILIPLTACMLHFLILCIQHI